MGHPPFLSQQHCRQSLTPRCAYGVGHPAARDRQSPTTRFVYGMGTADTYRIQYRYRARNYQQYRIA